MAGMFHIAHIAKVTAEIVVYGVPVVQFYRWYCRFMYEHQKPKANITTLFDGEK